MTATSTRAPLVVGGRFTEFLAHRDTVPVDELLVRLRAGEHPGPVRVGMGATAAQRAELTALLGADAVVPQPVERGLVHKRDGKNVLVSHPQPAGDHVWEAELVLDETTETLEDHLTGQHVPAITLLEAARQMWTAVTELYLVAADGPRTRFVVVSMGGEFHSYVFPIAAGVRYTLLERSRDGAGETFHCRVELRPTGARGPAAPDAPAVVVTGHYRVVPEAVAAKQESLAARRAVSASAPA